MILLPNMSFVCFRKKNGSNLTTTTGGLAQMVERVLRMHEVPGSIPGSSIYTFFIKNELFIIEKQAVERI